jgi:hypothetical protein
MKRTEDTREGYTWAGGMVSVPKPKQTSSRESNHFRGDYQDDQYQCRGKGGVVACPVCLGEKATELKLKTRAICRLELPLLVDKMQESSSYHRIHVA